MTTVFVEDHYGGYLLTYSDGKTVLIQTEDFGGSRFMGDEEWQSS